jgi:hypothetical protein
MQEFRRIHAGDQGDEAPPPGPPTLFSVFRVYGSRVSDEHQPITLTNLGGEEKSLAGKRFGESLSHPWAELVLDAR